MKIIVLEIANEQALQEMNPIKIEKGENIEMIDQEKTRAVPDDMCVIKIEDKNDDYRMFPQTNSFHIKIHIKIMSPFREMI